MLPSPLALEPVGARVHDGSTMGYFPPEWAVAEKENGVVKMNYGLVENTAGVEARVLFELAYAISLDAPAGTVKLPADVKIGTAVTIGKDVDAFEVNVIALVS